MARGIKRAYRHPLHTRIPDLLGCGDQVSVGKAAHTCSSRCKLCGLPELEPLVLPRAVGLDDRQLSIR